MPGLACEDGVKWTLTTQYIETAFDRSDGGMVWVRLFYPAPLPEPVIEEVMRWPDFH
jgi:hypothetical protein